MKYIVIGAGPAGLTAAITLKRNGNDVLILEKNNNIGKKLLLTGNGKCNYWNGEIDYSHYKTDNIDILKEIISDDNKNKALEFFDSIGIYPKIKNGYYYPYSNTSYAVYNALLKESKELNIDIIYNESVIDIKHDDNFIIKTNNNTYESKHLILACGSNAYPKTGSDGFGYDVLSNFSHKINKVLPALTKLVSDTKLDWAGIRCDSSVSLYIDNKLVKEETGEVQLTNDGASGICVMNLSAYASSALNNNKKVELVINFLPEIDINKLINDRSNKLKNRTIIELLEGLINYKLLYIILKNMVNKKWNELNNKEKELVIDKLTNYRLNIVDTGDFNQSQICTGGLTLNEINPKTMESTIVSNLYVIGDLLDIAGSCGGFNLAISFITGILVGSDNND